MAAIQLPEKALFDQQVNVVSNRIESITSGNTMANLLNSNFKKWLSNSAMDPITLTQELDTNKDNVISGDEFANLLGKMTGERPPEWVVELVFSFVDADPKRGIPLENWMAFLAASGLEIPEELYEVKVDVNGSIAILEDTIEQGETVSITVSFNVEVVAYEFLLYAEGSSEAIDNRLIPNSDMDRPDFDEFEIEIDTPGTYSAELRHLGVRLDTQEFTVLARPEPVHEEPEEAAMEEGETHEPDVVVATAEEGSFGEFVAVLEAAKLRSDAQALMAEAPAFRVHAHVNAVSRTLLGNGAYRNGMTLHCTEDSGFQFRVMLKPDDEIPVNGDRFVGDIAMHDWDVALRQPVCLEL